MKKYADSFAFIFAILFTFCIAVAYVVDRFFKIRLFLKIDLKYLPKN